MLWFVFVPPEWEFIRYYLVVPAAYSLSSAFYLQGIFFYSDIIFSYEIIPDFPQIMLYFPITCFHSSVLFVDNDPGWYFPVVYSFFHSSHLYSSLSYVTLCTAMSREFISDIREIAGSVTAVLIENVLFV